MASTLHEDARTAAERLAARQNQDDAAWEARFDRHVSSTLSKRTLPMSKRNTAAVAPGASSSALASASASASASTSASTSTSASQVTRSSTITMPTTTASAHTRSPSSVQREEAPKPAAASTSVLPRTPAPPPSTTPTTALSATKTSPALTAPRPVPPPVPASVSAPSAPSEPRAFRSWRRSGDDYHDEEESHRHSSSSRRHHARHASSSSSASYYHKHDYRKPPRLRQDEHETERSTERRIESNASLRSDSHTAPSAADEYLVPLPHELPFDPESPNFIAWPPPAVSAALGNAHQRSSSTDGKRFATRPSEGSDSLSQVVKDPRLKLIADKKYGHRGRKKLVTELQTVTFERDMNSVGPPPPTAVLVTGFGDEHGEKILAAHFSKFGKVAEHLAELDRDLGTRMPFLWIRYEHDFDAQGRVKGNLAPGIVPRNGAEIVRNVLAEMDGYTLPGTGTAGSAPLQLRVRVDHTGEKYSIAFAAEMRRRRAQRLADAPARADPVRHAHSPVMSAHSATTPHAHYSTSPGSSRTEHYPSIPNGRTAAAYGTSSRAHGWNAPSQQQQQQQQQQLQLQHYQSYPHHQAAGSSRWHAHESGPREVVDAPRGPRASREEQHSPRSETRPNPPFMRVGRLGGVPPPVNHTTPPLTTEEVLRRLAHIGRPYFRWPKGVRKSKFSDIKNMFHGVVNIELLEHDDTHFYCCLKSQALTEYFHREPRRHLLSGEEVILQFMLPPSAADVSSSSAAKQPSHIVLNQLADAIVSTAKQHAEQHLDGMLRGSASSHPVAAVDAMAMLASAGSISTTPTAKSVPLPSIKRREHIPAEELEEALAPPPAKIRKVSNRSAREYQDYRSGALDMHGGRSAGKCSSPLEAPAAQATPTESTRMGDTSDDEVGDIKDDETQTTEEVVEERSREEDEKKRAANASNGLVPSRGIKRPLKRIFSSDEEDGNDDADATSELGDEAAEDDDDDDSCVSKSLLSFKPSPKAKKHANGRRKQIVEPDDVLASMLLDTVSSMQPVQVHDVNLQEDDDAHNWDAAKLDPQNLNGSLRKQPPKAAAKANKKAKLAQKKAAPPAPTKSKARKSKPEPIVIEAPEPEPEIAIVVTKADDHDTAATESVPPTPVDGVASGPRSAPKKSDPRTKKGRRERARSPSPDPFALNFAQNEEDLYFLRLACERIRDGLGVGEEDVLEIGEDGSVPAHASGAARTEGYYKIPASQKAAHLPDRNQAIAEETTAVRTVASARGNRAESRRVLMNIELHKKESATDTDILKFNQLSARKKQLKFAKSPIHDWGLYAMELIPAGDMVIEYVGEVIRQQVADEREKRYERQGQYSTYLFRVDDELVVDATMKGNIARLMNHCCTPNCNAKILTVNGEKRIALFAKSAIYPGQELTYDYKFQSTGDDADQIACLCGSANCRKFL